MSGADCKDGCTSCPTCRGEVRPDSPAMHDMDFAMAMHEQSGADPFWSAMAIAQGVRDGTRARGGDSPDDQRILDFVEGVAQGVGGGAARVPWIVPFGLFDGRPAPPAAPPAPAPVRVLDWDNTRPRVAAVKNTRISGATLNPMRSRKRMFGDLPMTVITPNYDPGAFVPLLQGQMPVRGKLRVPSTELNRRKCCVEKFLFPEFMRSTTRKSGDLWRVSFEFWVAAEYREDADCACCYFEQYARRLDKNETYRQDCTWVNKSGETRNVTFDTPPDDAEIECDDTIHGGEVVGPEGDKVKHVGEMRRVMQDESLCVHRYYDEPFQEFEGIAWAVTWEFIGIVYDVCHNWAVQRAGWLQWTETREPWPRDVMDSGGQSEGADGASTTAQTTRPPPPGIKPSSKRQG